MQQHLIEHHKIDGDFGNMNRGIKWKLLLKLWILYFFFAEMYCYVQQNCPACGRIFKDQRSARTHYTRMHTPQQQQQQLQLQQSGSNGAVRDAAEQQHMCTACDKVFNLKASLQAHQRFCQVKQPVHCNFCEQQFSSMRKYELHLQQQHAVDTLHECEICLKSFKNSESLAVHRKRHSERHYQCAKCSLNYINAAELRVHYERAHVQEEQVVSVAVAPVNFKIMHCCVSTNREIIKSQKSGDATIAHLKPIQGLGCGSINTSTQIIRTSASTAQRSLPIAASKWISFHIILSEI